MLTPATKIPTDVDVHRSRLESLIATDEAEKDRLNRSREIYTDNFLSTQHAAREAATLNRLHELAAEAGRSIAFAFENLTAKRQAAVEADNASYDFARLNVMRQEAEARVSSYMPGYANGETADTGLANELRNALRGGDRHAMRAIAGIAAGRESANDPEGVRKLVAQVNEALAPAEVARFDANLDQLAIDAEAYSVDAYHFEKGLDHGAGWHMGRRGNGVWGPPEASPVAQALGDLPAERFEGRNVPPTSPTPFQRLVGVRG